MIKYFSTLTRLDVKTISFFYLQASIKNRILSFEPNRQAIAGEGNNETFRFGTREIFGKYLVSDGDGVISVVSVFAERGVDKCDVMVERDDCLIRVESE